MSVYQGPKVEAVQFEERQTLEDIVQDLEKTVTLINSTTENIQYVLFADTSGFVCQNTPEKLSCIESSISEVLSDARNALAVLRSIADRLSNNRESD